MNYTDITVLVDRSGSMSIIRAAMESGFDEFLSEHRKNPSTRLTQVQFDNQNPCEVVYSAMPIGQAGRLTIEPRGMTPLRDALCNVIDLTGRRLADMAERDRPARVLFITITDGLENASRLHTAADVRTRIQRQEGTYNWQFVYLGANQDALLEAEKIGISALRAITYDVNRVDPMWKGLTSNTATYANTGTAGSLNWSDTDRKEAAEKLTIAPTNG